MVGDGIKVVNGQAFWSWLLETRKRWSNFGPMRGWPSSTVEAKARMPMDTDNRVHGAVGKFGEAKGSNFDAEVMHDWRA